MNEIQAIRLNERRRAIETIRVTMAEVRRLYAELPYCDRCHCRVLRRAPCEHLKQS